MSFNAQWTGWLTVPLNNGRGLVVADVDVNVRRDLVLFSIGNRNIGVIDRDEFRRWIVHPHPELHRDDVVFLSLAGELCISVDASVPYVLPKDAVQEFVRLI